ncbi:MAG TPA: hypothetical protein VHO48_00055 [Anaerolineaceae bacterium]|nr:hypothetical protein [Anaerolineaceae bacterium]
MRRLTIYLRAFGHPAIWAAVFLLVINDHLLKSIRPGWITGKLSDFAGVFFFPFLLAALIACWPCRRLSPRQVMGLSITATVIGFGLLKISPGVNQLAVDALSQWSGLNIQIKLDPSDLLAFSMLGPAWRLWTHLENAPRTRSVVLERVGFTFAVLATIATTPCPGGIQAAHLVSTPEGVYVSIWNDAYLTSDSGYTWVKVNPSPEVKASLDSPVDYPRQVCWPDHREQCYRAAGHRPVEVSMDGGISWRTAWTLPQERIEFLKRYYRSVPFLAGCGRRTDSVAYDVNIVPAPGGYALLVAMGGEGILRYQDGVGWERIAVNDIAFPTPYSTRDLRQIKVMFVEEQFAAIALGLMLITALSIFSMSQTNRYNRRPEADPHKRLGWVTRPLMWMGIWMVIVGVLFLLRTPRAQEIGWVAVKWTPYLYLGSLVWSWLRAVKISLNQTLVGLQGLLCILASVAAPAIMLLILLGWAMGLIWRYSLAMALAVIAGLLVTGVSGMGLRRIARQRSAEQ